MSKKGGKGRNAQGGYIKCHKREKSVLLKQLCELQVVKLYREHMEQLCMNHFIQEYVSQRVCLCL